jgi:hypothetical protein
MQFCHVGSFKETSPELKYLIVPLPQEPLILQHSYLFQIPVKNDLFFMSILFDFKDVAYKDHPP